MTHPGSWRSFLWGPLKATFPSGYFGGDLPTHLLRLQISAWEVKGVFGTFLVFLCLYFWVKSHEGTKCGAEDAVRPILF